MEKKRIEYIDAMRGFTMILVIFYHVINRCFMLNDVGYNSIFILFRMPLFFFISGFVFYKGERRWNIYTISDIISKKFMVQILPTAVFLFLFLYLHNSIEWSSFGTFKSGYWFTLVLFEYYLFYSFFAFIIRGVLYVWWGEVLVLLFALFISLLGFYYIEYYPYIGYLKPIGELLDTLNWRFFLFFCIGVMARKYFESLNKLIDNQYVIAFILCIFSVMAFFSVESKEAENNYINFFLCGLLGIIIVFAFFKRYSDSFAKENKLGYWLQYVGKRTLDVYLLHYFFLPTNLEHLGQYLTQYSNPVIDFFITISLSIMVLCFILVVSNIIRLSPFLAHYLFGVKREG